MGGVWSIGMSGVGVVGGAGKRGGSHGWWGGGGGGEKTPKRVLHVYFWTMQP